MRKKYIVRLSEEERDTLRAVIKKLSGSSQKVRRAHILLKADADGPNVSVHTPLSIVGADRLVFSFESVMPIRTAEFEPT